MAHRLLASFLDHAALRPDAPAVRQVEARQTVTYRDLARRAFGLAGVLAAHVAEGDVVLLASPNDAQFIATFLAILSLGARAFPVSPELAGPELAAAVDQAKPVAAVATEGVLAAVGGKVAAAIPLRDIPLRDISLRDVAGHGAERPPCGRDVSRAALLLQSSGTTGSPKIVARDGPSLDAVSQAMVEAIGFRPDDRVLLPIPLCHSYGIEHGLLAPVMAGSRAHLCRGFDLPLVLNELTAGGVTIFPGVPFMFETLAGVGSDTRPVPNLRRAYSAGGPLPAGVFEAFKRRYGVPVAQLYGATEIGSVLFNDPDAPGPFDPASVGRPMRGVDVRVLDVEQPHADRPLPVGAEGQVAVRADSMMSGYLRDDADATTTVDGYFLTGDLGRLDARGRLTLTGRIKLLIDVGGLKVNPLEVEAVLAQHPEVAACVVLPVRVSDTVNRLKAIVQPRDPAAPGPTAESLRQFARERLTPYKVPRVFEVRATLPRSPTGKILRHLVAA
jgi:acyl-CoA synthetase (AMP-forming)/AMP-acid ligase II